MNEIGNAALPSAVTRPVMAEEATPAPQTAQNATEIGHFLKMATLFIG